MKRAVAIIFSYAVLSFALCLGISSFMGRLPPLLEEFKRTYILCRGLLYFFRILPAILCSGYLVAMAVEFGNGSDKAFMRFSSAIMAHFKRVIIFSVCLVAIITCTAEIAKPLVQRKKNYAENSIRLMSEYIRLGNECLDEENYVLAHRYGTQILKIRPLSQEGKNLIDKSEAVLKAIKKVVPQENSTAKEDQLFDEISGESVTSLIEKSKDAAQKQHWFESHYYAQLATFAGNEKDINIKEARRLASVAWNELQSASVSAKTKDQILFAKKRSAYKALSEGNNIESYYQFLDISKQDETWASDPDVTRFLTIAQNRVENQYFFIDETEKLESFETFMNVYFTVKHKSGNTDVVYIRGITPVYNSGRMVQYLRNLNVTTFSKNGSFVKSIKVPYAKMVSLAVSDFDEETRSALELDKKVKRVPYILLESVDRNERGRKIVPEYEFADYVRNEQRKNENSLILAISYDDFNTACEQSGGLEEMRLDSLMKVAEKADSLGFSAEVAGAYLIKRITYPVIMFAYLLFLSSLAWNFRIKSEQLFKFVWIVIIPVCTLACDILMQVIIAIANLFNFLFVVELGSAGLMACLVLWIVILFFDAIYFVMRRNS